MEVLKELGIGILRIEKTGLEKRQNYRTSIIKPGLFGTSGT